MGTPPGEQVELHARPVVRSLRLGEDDLDEVVADTTAAVAELLDRPAAVLLTGSCSAALEAAAALVSLDPGDEVVVPAFSFPTAIAPFASRGARIRFADVDARTGNVDPASVRAKLGPRTRAVVAMHYAGIGAVDLGLAADLDDAGISLVEDAAHGLLARRDGRTLGTLGRFGCLSFHRTKNLSALDGGALVVNRADDVDAATTAIDKGTDRAAFFAGRTSSYDWRSLGGAWRMPEGAVRYLAEELPRLEACQRRRHEVRAAYDAALTAWAAETGVALPVVPDGCESPSHLYHLLLPSAGDRPGFVEHCARAGVQAARHYGSMPASPFGRTLHHPDDACPVADDLAVRLVRIPLHHALSDGDVARSVEAVTSWKPSGGERG